MLVQRFFSAVLIASTACGVLINKTIDDLDTSIVYNGQWTTTDCQQWFYMGCHHYTQDPSASATFTFTGVAIYYMAAHWNFGVNTIVGLDGDELNNVNLTSPDSNMESYEVVWSKTGLPNGTYTLVNKVPSASASSSYGLMDGLIITYDDGSPSPASGSDSSKPKIIGGAVGGVVGVIILLSVALVLWRRKKSKSSAREGSPFTLDMEVPQAFESTPFVTQPSPFHTSTVATMGSSPNGMGSPVLDHVAMTQGQPRFSTTAVPPPYVLDGSSSSGSDYVRTGIYSSGYQSMEKVTQPAASIPS